VADRQGRQHEGRVAIVAYTPSDDGISAMVDIAGMPGLRLNPGQRSALDGLITQGLIEKA
jgi:hypothetical protein